MNPVKSLMPSEGSLSVGVDSGISPVVLFIGVGFGLGSGWAISSTSSGDMIGVMVFGKDGDEGGLMSILPCSDSFVVLLFITTCR